jgi:hypothetical protein
VVSRWRSGTIGLKTDDSVSAQSTSQCAAELDELNSPRDVRTRLAVVLLGMGRDAAPAKSRPPDTLSDMLNRCHVKPREGRNAMSR